jgi:ubiquitin-conjugating enzyme E2 W
MQEHVPPGIAIVKCDNLEEWQMDIKILDQNPLYLDQTYRLKFTFSNKYPIGKSRFLSRQLISLSSLSAPSCSSYLHPISLSDHHGF